MSDLQARGWLLSPATIQSRAWARAARSVAVDLIERPDLAHWWRHGATWFAGVDVMPTDPVGTICDRPLPAEVLDRLEESGSARPLHPAQLSVVRPGYPFDDGSEPRAAARFRRQRDGAHLDGLLPVGSKRQRMLKEPHAIILGLALTEVTVETSPLVVWEGSAQQIQRLFQSEMEATENGDFRDLDVTEKYRALRRRVFETCKRTPVTAKPGDMIWVHRHAIHGIAPWRDGSVGPPEGRMIAYFRPHLRDPGRWLQAN